MEKIVIRKTNRCDTRTLAPGAVVTEEAAKKDTLYHIDIPVLEDLPPF